MRLKVVVRFTVCLALGLVQLGDCPPAKAERKRCGSCYGSGRCRHCGGDGVLRSCTTCNGSGRVRNHYAEISSDSHHTTSCRTCYGSGKKRCYYCRASGRCRSCVGGYTYGKTGSSRSASRTRRTTGTATKSRSSRPIKMHCAACRGTGTLAGGRCGGCGGAGSIVQCPGCKGLGRVGNSPVVMANPVCRNCSGYGILPAR